MRKSPTLLAAVLCCAASVAYAAPCYVVYDRNDAVVYRDYKPPFDMSSVSSSERDMMRRQGQHLLVAEFGDGCNPVGFISAATGATAATVDQIVGDVRSAAPTAVATSGATQAAPKPGSKPVAATSAKQP